MAKKPTKALRPSFANIVAKCIAAAHGDGDAYAINWEGDGAGKVGSAVHDAAKCIVKYEEVPTDEIIRRYTLSKAERRDYDHLLRVVRKYCQMELHSGAWQSDLVTEQRLDDRFETARYIYNLGGTMDVGGFSSDGTIWTVLDWKTTRLENVDYAPQLMIYLWLAKNWVERHLPQSQWPRYYQYHIVFLRDWTDEISAVFTAEELDAYVSQFIGAVEDWDHKEYHPGKSCIYCPRQAECPAMMQTIASFGRALLDVDLPERLEAASDDEVFDFHQKAGMLTLMIKQRADLIKALVVGRGSEIATPGGVLTTTLRPNYRIDYGKAEPFLKKVLTKEQIHDAIRLSKGDLMDAVGDNTPRGQKGTAKTAFWESLVEHEAVEQTDSLVLTVKKAKVVSVNFEETKTDD